jgi:hypothetical protein
MIDLRWRPRQTTLDGEPVLIMDIDVRDDIPGHIKEGLARRAVVNGGGVCPGGARMISPNRAARQHSLTVAVVRPAGTENDGITFFIDAPGTGACISD